MPTTPCRLVVADADTTQDWCFSDIFKWYRVSLYNARSCFGYIVLKPVCRAVISSILSIVFRTRFSRSKDNTWDIISVWIVTWVNFRGSLIYH